MDWFIFRHRWKLKITKCYFTQGLAPLICNSMHNWINYFIEKAIVYLTVYITL